MDSSSQTPIQGTARSPTSHTGKRPREENELADEERDQSTSKLPHTLPMETVAAPDLSATDDMEITTEPADLVGNERSISKFEQLADTTVTNVEGATDGTEIKMEASPTQDTETGERSREDCKACDQAIHRAIGWPWADNRRPDDGPGWRNFCYAIIFEKYQVPDANRRASDLINRPDEYEEPRRAFESAWGSGEFHKVAELGKLQIRNWPQGRPSADHSPFMWCSR